MGQVDEQPYNSHSIFLPIKNFNLILEMKNFITHIFNKEQVSELEQNQIKEESSWRTRLRKGDFEENQIKKKRDRGELDQIRELDENQIKEESNRGELDHGSGLDQN